MKTRLLGLLAAALIAAPAASHATPVTWRFDGLTTFSSGQILGLGVHTNDPFHFLLNFDTSAPLRFCSLDAGGGTQCRYNWDSIGFSKIFLGSQGPFNPGFAPNDTGSLLVRDNFPAPPGDPNVGQLTDGLSFGRDLADRNGDAHFFIILRGPVLGIINGPGIPSVPDPRLAALAISDFGVCLDAPGAVAFTCDGGEYHGDITSIVAAATPEPATYAMVGLGLALLAGMRRRVQRQHSVASQVAIEFA